MVISVLIVLTGFALIGLFYQGFALRSAQYTAANLADSETDLRRRIEQLEQVAYARRLALEGVGRGVRGRVRAGVAEQIRRDDAVVRREGLDVDGPAAGAAGEAVEQQHRGSVGAPLLLQPLLENAIYHGIENLPEGGEVIVTGRRDSERLSISVSNPVASLSERRKSGNKMALDNIRQRFEIAYGTRATVGVDDSGRQFAVNLSFPYEEGAA